MKSPIPNDVMDIELYKKARKKTEKVFGSTTSAYRSMYLVKTYKAMGGRYKSSKKTKNTTKWLKERWIIVQDYINKGKIVNCGEYKKDRHACRPLIRIDNKTPITIKEVIKKHGKDKTRKLAKMKESGASKIRIDWKKGKKY